MLVYLLFKFLAQSFQIPINSVVSTFLLFSMRWTVTSHCHSYLGHICIACVLFNTRIQLNKGYLEYSAEVQHPVPRTAI